MFKLALFRANSQVTFLKHFFASKTVVPFVSPIPGHNIEKFPKVILLSIYHWYICKNSRQIKYFYIECPGLGQGVRK